jgi:hypothetical protein
MRRWALRISVLLLLGAIVNVAVIAAISAYTSRGTWAKVMYKALKVTEEEAVAIQRAQALGPPGRTYSQNEARGFGWKSTMASSTDQPIAGDEGRFFQVRVFDAGWPMLALQGEWRWGNSQVMTPGFHNAVGRYRVVRSGIEKGSEADMFPLWPLWPGFAINTVFYAAVLWLLFAAPFALRKWRRIRRGLCRKCGYDLRGGHSATCPECGATVKTPAKDRSVSLPAVFPQSPDNREAPCCRTTGFRDNGRIPGALAARRSAPHQARAGLSRFLCRQAFSFPGEEP